MDEHSVDEAFRNKWFKYRDKWYKERLDEYNKDTPEEERFSDEIFPKSYSLNVIYVQKELGAQTEEEKAFCKKALGSFVASNMIQFSDKEIPFMVSARGVPEKMIKDSYMFLRENPGFIDSTPDKKSGCFIATATFEDYNAPEVIFFRKWRDETLMKSISGRLFIHYYYKITPVISAMITRNRSLKKISKSFLLKVIQSLRK